MSLIVKARPDGATIYTLLMGYEEAPEEFALTQGNTEEPYFEGNSKYQCQCL